MEMIQQQIESKENLAMEPQLILRLKSEILKNSLIPKRISKLPAKLDGLSIEELTEILTSLYQGVVEDRGNVFRDIDGCLSLKKVDSQMLKTDAIQLFKQTRSLL